MVIIVQTVLMPLVGFCSSVMMEADGESDSGRLIVTVDTVETAPPMSVDCARLSSNVEALSSAPVELMPGGKASVLDAGFPSSDTGAGTARVVSEFAFVKDDNGVVDGLVLVLIEGAMLLADVAVGLAILFSVLAALFTGTTMLPIEEVSLSPKVAIPLPGVSGPFAGVSVLVTGVTALGTMFIASGVLSAGTVGALGVAATRAVPTAPDSAGVAAGSGSVITVVWKFDGVASTSLEGTTRASAAAAGDESVLSRTVVGAAGATRPRPPTPSPRLELPIPTLKTLPPTPRPTLLVPTPSERIGAPLAAVEEEADAETEDELDVVVEV